MYTHNKYTYLHVSTSTVLYIDKHERMQMHTNNQFVLLYNGFYIALHFFVTVAAGQFNVLHR